MRRSFGKHVFEINAVKVSEDVYDHSECIISITDDNHSHSFSWQPIERCISLSRNIFQEKSHIYVLCVRIGNVIQTRKCVFINVKLSDKSSIELLLGFVYNSTMFLQLSAVHISGPIQKDESLRVSLVSSRGDSAMRRRRQYSASAEANSPTQCSRGSCLRCAATQRM